MDILTDANGRSYKVLNGTYYALDTTDDMVHRLEALRQSGKRVRFHWGNTQTGEDWEDTYDVTGTISRSMGPIKIPILLYNRLSRGGSGILSDCIVKIVTTDTHVVLYQHPTYHVKPGFFA